MFVCRPPASLRNFIEVFRSVGITMNYCHQFSSLVQAFVLESVPASANISATPGLSLNIARIHSVDHVFRSNALLLGALARKSWCECEEQCTSDQKFHNQNSKANLPRYSRHALLAFTLNPVTETRPQQRHRLKWSSWP